MKVLSAAEMQACDRATTERFGIPSLHLMRNASAAVAEFARRQFPQARRVTVLCGRGNNGGDGMMAARLLGGSGLQVTVLLLGTPDGIKGDAAEAWRKLQGAGNCRVSVIESEEQFGHYHAALEADLIIDAVLGTGFKPPMKGLALAAFEWIKRTGTPILAVDLPSGWPADETRGTMDEPVFPADAVVTFTAPKPAHVFGQLTRRWDQPIVVAPIGSPDEAVISELNLHWAGSAQRLLHQPRNFDSNKGNFGHVLVVGGCFGPAGGKAGAPAMTSLAALRAGAGLVTAAVPTAALPIVSGFAPELMTLPLKANEAGQISSENLENLESLTKGATVLAIGPGMGQGADVKKFLTFFLFATKMPVVIDADGLNNLAADENSFPKTGNLLEKLGRERTVVLTPHPGEMARLAGIGTKQVQANRLETARSFAVEHRVTVVLKGAHTLIAHPDGRVAVNTTGNPGMAKGGSGDLLTGVIAGLLAQFPQDAARAVEAAVHLHGLAADIAVREKNEHTLLATDTLPCFSAAFRFHSRARNGYVWLQGLPPDSSTANGSGEAAE
ncbi:MAG TPA: NAD(P)H-hydrate dehydratase [Terracidiphilus sp.]|jgi:NAD(P)H-hydrate epimerase|nr:NAD(P)H-hydrate dehydratase [Terracidiphilus sp.]